MSALLNAGPSPGGRRLQPMTPRRLDDVMAVETAAYPFPWTRGNFVDSVAAGYAAQVLIDDGGGLLGYFIAMPGVDELHLLNITVAPRAQARGHASFMFAALQRLAREQHATELWLEVRVSNQRARSIYRRWGLREVSVRKGYYPAAHGQREDAVVMSLGLVGAARGGGDALE